MSENIIRCPAESYMEPDPRGMGVVFIEKMKMYADHIAQIDATTGETQTYNDILLRSIRVAQQLQARGYTSHDTITLCIPNILDACLPFLAAIYLEIVVSSLDPSLSCQDSEHLLKLVKPRIIFCEADSVELIETALRNAGLNSELVVLGETKKYTPFSEFLVSSGTEDKFEVKPVDDMQKTAVILFSSGTTGLPKGICASHYGLISQQLQMLQGHQYDTILYYTSLYWISSVALLIIGILQGTTRILCRKFDSEQALQTIEKYKVTFGFMSPFIVNSMIQSPKYHLYDTSSLSSIIVGGSVIGEDQLALMRRCFPHSAVCYGYGMTENHGHATYFNPKTNRHLMELKPRSVGIPIPGFTYKIVDPETEEILGPNKQGEFRIKGKALTVGYHRNPVESAKAFDKDGFLHSGDIGYYDEDHCFYIIDRIKDVLKYQSWHVPPAELETILQTHPAVQEAAVVGKPHPLDGEHPMGAIVLKPGHKVTEDELLHFFNVKVPERKKMRGGIKFVDSLPYTPTGKLRRRELRDSLINGEI